MAEPIATWLTGLGVDASVFRYPLNVRHPLPLEALRTEVRQRRASGAQRIWLMAFSAGGHLAGLAAEKRDFAATRGFFTQALGHAPRPSEVTNDRAPPTYACSMSCSAPHTT